jgi:hypothetical protein
MQSRNLEFQKRIKENVPYHLHNYVRLKNNLEEVPF